MFSIISTLLFHLEIYMSYVLLNNLVIMKLCCMIFRQILTIYMKNSISQWPSRSMWLSIIINNILNGLTRPWDLQMQNLPKQRTQLSKCRSKSINLRLREKLEHQFTRKWFWSHWCGTIPKEQDMCHQMTSELEKVHQECGHRQCHHLD